MSFGEKEDLIAGLPRMTKQLKVREALALASDEEEDEAEIQHELV